MGDGLKKLMAVCLVQVLLFMGLPVEPSQASDVSQSYLQQQTWGRHSKGFLRLMRLMRWAVPAYQAHFAGNSFPAMPGIEVSATGNTTLLIRDHHTKTVYRVDKIAADGLSIGDGVFLHEASESEWPDARVQLGDEDRAENVGDGQPNPAQIIAGDFRALAKLQKTSNHQLLYVFAGKKLPRYYSRISQLLDRIDAEFPDSLLRDGEQIKKEAFINAVSALSFLFYRHTFRRWRPRTWFQNDTVIKVEQLLIAQRNFLGAMPPSWKDDRILQDEKQQFLFDLHLNVFAFVYMYGSIHAHIIDHPQLQDFTFSYLDVRDTIEKTFRSMVTDLGLRLPEGTDELRVIASSDLDEYRDLYTMALLFKGAVSEVIANALIYSREAYQTHSPPVQLFRVDDDLVIEVITRGVTLDTDTMKKMFMYRYTNKQARGPEEKGGFGVPYMALYTLLIGGSIEIISGNNRLRWRHGVINIEPLSGVGAAPSEVRARFIFPMTLFRSHTAVAGDGMEGDGVKFRSPIHVFGSLGNDQFEQGPTDRVTATDFSHDGKLLATASNDGTIWIWNLETKEVKRVLQGSDAWVRVIAWGPENRLVASSTDNRIRLWDTETGRQLARIQGKTHWIHTLTFGKNLYDRLDENEVIGVGKRGEMLFWDYKTGEKNFIESRFHTVAFNEASRRRVELSKHSMTAHVRDEDNKKIAQLDNHPHKILFMSFNRDGNRLATVDDGDNIQIWEIGTERALGNIYVEGIYTWEFSHDGRLLATVGKDKRTIRVYTARAGERQGTYRGRNEVINVKFSKDNKWLSSGHEDGTTALYDLGHIIRQVSPAGVGRQGDGISDHHINWRDVEVDSLAGDGVVTQVRAEVEGYTSSLTLEETTAMDTQPFVFMTAHPKSIFSALPPGLAAQAFKVTLLETGNTRQMDGAWELELGPEDWQVSGQPGVVDLRKASRKIRELTGWGLKAFIPHSFAQEHTYVEGILTPDLLIQGIQGFVSTLALEHHLSEEEAQELLTAILFAYQA